MEMGVILAAGPFGARDTHLEGSYQLSAHSKANGDSFIVVVGLASGR